MKPSEKSSPQTAADIRAELADAKERETRAVAAQKAHAAARPGVALRGTAEDLKKHDEVAAEQSREIERLDAAIKDCTARLAAAEESEAGETRRRKCEAARAQGDAIRKKVSARYPVLAGELAALLAEEKAADEAIMAANRTMPPGAGIDSVEVGMRTFPGKARRDPLWQTVALPGFAPDDRPYWPPVRVAATSAGATAPAASVRPIPPPATPSRGAQFHTLSRQGAA